MSNNILEIRGLSKAFSGVYALKNVDIDIKRGSVHCIVGENGAGKSTLIKILTGVYTRTSGEIFMDGTPIVYSCVRDAMNAGVHALYQELNIVEHLTVEENLTLGTEKTKFGIVKPNEERNAEFEKFFEEFEFSISLKSRMVDLSYAKRQLVQIARSAVGSDAKVIIMDEPTASLSEGEIQKLHHIIKKLKEKGITIIYISHRLEELFAIGDEVTVLRDGCVITTKKLSDIKTKADLVADMLGKMVSEQYIPSGIEFGPAVLKCIGINNNRLQDINFELYEGEILGFYGLIGSGKTELARAIYGLDEYEGDIIVNDAVVHFKRPKQAIKSGIAMLPEERRKEGIFKDLSIKENIPVMNPKLYSKYGFVNSRKETEIAKHYIATTKVAARSHLQAVGTLSGGNQQKVVASKCINAETPIILLDEPTRGVDIGSKEEIYQIIRGLVKNKKSVIVFTSELNEAFNICDRILLLHEGKICGEVQNGPDIDQNAILQKVSGSN